MPFKSIDDIKSFSKYKSVIKNDLAQIKATPMKFHYYEKFKFQEHEGPLLLVGEVQPKILEEINKATKGVKGRCHLENDNIQFDKAGSGDMRYVSVAKLVKLVGLSKDVRLGAGPEDEDKLVGKELGEKFQGEDKKLGWRTEDPARKNLDTTTTKYERTPEERAKSQAIPTAKGLTDSAGTALQGKQGFVMDPKTGQVHTFQSEAIDLPGGKKQLTHHSTPLAGAPVAGAGHLVTESGRVQEIHDDSGHYRPSAEFTLQVVQQLEALGVSLKDNKLTDAKGVDVVPEYKAKYKEIKERIGALQAAYDKEKEKLGAAFNPAKLNPALTSARADIQKNLAELRALGVAPANRPAVVQLQGKTGLSAEEFKDVKGNLAKINALLEKKTGRKDLLPANTEAKWLQGVDALNLKIGEALKVRLTTQQFAQTGGNEKAIRDKAQVVAALNERAKTVTVLTAEEFEPVKGDLAKINAILEKKTRRKNLLPANTDAKTLKSLDALNLQIRDALKAAPVHEPVGAAKVAIDAQAEKMKTREQEAKPKTIEERIAELGGEEKIVKLGFPGDKLGYLGADDKLAVLKGEMTIKEVRSKTGV